MAADLMLLDNYSQDDYPVFRIYDWECPTLSLGRNEVLDSRIDLEVCESLEIPVVRRTTGGQIHAKQLSRLLFGEQQEFQDSHTLPNQFDCQVLHSAQVKE
jgi:lipoate-protein ligase A